MKVTKLANKNATVIESGGKVVLFSYETPVAAHDGEKMVRTDQHYSNTTSRHINSFLNGAKAETVSQSYLDNLLK